MLPGVAPPGRGMPGRGIPGPAGRAPGGPCGRGMGRSTGWAEENGLLPTRGGRATPGLGAAGPGRGPGASVGAGAAGAAGAAGGAATGGATGVAATGAAGAAATAPPFVAAGALAAGFAAAFGAAGALAPPNDSRNRRATGASTVDDADLTNSPCSLSRARTSLLVTPSSLANSCTRALPATTSPSLEATAGGPRLGFSYDAWSSGLHGVLMFFATCSVAGPTSAVKCSSTADVSGEPVMRSARAKARRRVAASRQRRSGCSQAPRPGWCPALSTVTAN